MVELSFQHYLLGLFAVANNFSAIGMFLSICNGLSQKEIRRLYYIATLSSLITMIVTLVAGQLVLEFFGISIPAFRIAGGILLAGSGMSMLNSNANTQEITHHGTLSEVIPVAIVPISIPLTIGAGTMSTIILFSDKLTNWRVTGRLLAAILVMSFIIFIIFKYSTVLFKVLGRVGMNVLSKILGLITLAIGIQFMIAGVQTVFPMLTR